MSKSVYGDNLRRVLAMMAASLKNAPKDLAACHDAFCLALTSRKVAPDLLIPACEVFVTSSTWFPTPAEFIAAAERVAERRVVDRRLALTTKALALETRRRRAALVAAGIDPDEEVPTEGILRMIQGLGAKALPERTK